MATFTTDQIKTLALLTAGYSSEVKNKSSFTLSLAWSINKVTGVYEPIGKSGYSVGVNQTDFGQQTDKVADFVSAYQQWAGNDPSRLVSVGISNLQTALSADGPKLHANGNALLLSKSDEAKINAFTASAAGRQTVWNLDMKQLDIMNAAAQRLMQTPGFNGFVSDDDKALVLSVYMKAVNQGGTGKLASDLYNMMLKGDVSWNQIQDAAYNKIPGDKDYWQTGFDGTKAGALLFAKILNSDTTLADWLDDLGTQDLKNLGQAGFASDPRYQVLERLFRDTKQGSSFVDNLEVGKPMVMQLPAGLNGQAQTIGIDKDGEMFTTGKAGTYRHIDDEWLPAVNGDEKGTGLFLRPSKDGKKLLLASADSDEGGMPLFEFSDNLIAQVNINGTEVTLDASKPGQYAFLDSGDLVYAERNGALISGTRLTGSNPGSFEIEFRGLSAANPDIRLVSFSTSDPLVDSQNDYRFVQTDAQGRITTTDISPITRNIDGVDVIVGSSRFVGITQNGQPISQTSTELQTQAGTGNQITTTDAKLYSNGVLSSHTETTQTSSASGLIPIETVIKTFGAQGTLVQTSTTTPDPDGSQNTIVRNGSGTTLYTSNVRYFDDDAGQSSLTETTYPNGRTETLATDSTGTPASLRITTPAGNNTETVDAYTYVAGVKTFQSSTTTETFYDENGTSRIETVTIPFGGSLTTTRQVYDTDGALVSSEPVVTGSQANTNITNPQTTAVLNDISGLIGAIQGGRPLPILNSGVRLINTFANPAGSAIQYPGLNQASGALSGLASLYNLSNSLQNGDDLIKISATLNTLNYVNSTLPSLLGASSALSPALNSFLNGSTGTVYNAAADGLISNGAGGLINGGAPGAIPVIGLIISIKNGDPFGTISGIIGIVNPLLLTTPVGWILAIASIVYSLTKETPESWGTARIIFDANGQIGIDTVGEGSGPQKVRQQLESTLAALNQQIAEVRAANPSALIGIVPQRTPSITWREQRQDDQGYAIVDIDPVTGAQRYPYLRFEQSVATTYLIAAPAIFYWARGLRGVENGAANDDFWRDAA